MHFQDANAYGRIVHLQPVRWVEDWPVMGADPDGDGVGQPVPSHAKPDVGQPVAVGVPATSDEFEGSALGLQWQWHANPQDDWISLSDRNGWLRLSAVPRPEEYRNLWQVPNLLLQKFPAPTFTASCRLDASHLKEGQQAGLVVMGIDYSYLCLERTASGLQIVRRTCRGAEGGNAEQVEATLDSDNALLEFRVQVSQGGMCSFAYRHGTEAWQEIGNTFKAREGKWIGAKVGLFCLAESQAQESGSADFDYIHFEN